MRLEIGGDLKLFHFVRFASQNLCMHRSFIFLYKIPKLSSTLLFITKILSKNISHVLFQQFFPLTLPTSTFPCTFLLHLVCFYQVTIFFFLFLTGLTVTIFFSFVGPVATITTCRLVFLLSSMYLLSLFKMLFVWSWERQETVICFWQELKSSCGQCLAT